MHFLPIEQQLEVIKRGVTEIIPENELVDKLKRSIKTGKPLRVKLGCDPTRPDLHLGHSVILRKLRQFQDLGHHAILIIGDFTATIGDPTGQKKMRPSLSMDEIMENAKTYFDQASRILDAEKTEIVYNSKWLGKMNFSDVIRLASKYTLARMIERDDFTNRYENNEPIALHEFLYPLAQGQDSVHLKSDIELGGQDQKFNLLVGRDLQKMDEQEPQVCLMMPLLVGTDGSAKMSKSYDNYIGIDEPPNDMYGKLLKVPDELIYTYFELISDVPVEDLPAIKEKAEKDPRNAKHDLALTITRMYYDTKTAQEAREYFEKTIIKKDIPDDIPEFPQQPGSVRLIELIRSVGFAPSNGEARRLIQQGGVSIDGNQITDVNIEIDIDAKTDIVLKVGKRRFGRIFCR